MKTATAKKENSAPSSNALEKWGFLYTSELKSVNEVIIKLTNDGTTPLIGLLAEHIIKSGGKRLRPILVLLSAKMCGYSGERHVNLAAAIEFIHTATLLHDDVVDESKLRRGQKTANEQWGNAASVLVGDFLLSRAFQLMARDGNLEILRILSDTSATMSEGEVKQLSTQNDIETSIETYIDVVERKTAKLFSAACEIGPVIAGKSSLEQEEMARFGHNLGVAFQIVDDVLDYSAKQEQLGKTIGEDFSEGKVTLPMILAYESADKKEKDFWLRIINDRLVADTDFRTAITIMTKRRLLDKAMSVAKDYAKLALAEISNFPDCDEKQALLELADFAVNRPY